MDGFTDSGTGIVVGPFQWNTTPPQWTVDGFTKVDNRQQAKGSGYDLEINNVNIIFIFNSGAPLEGLTLKFGEYGGNLNIKINGTFQNFENFADINNTIIGGVKVSVAGGVTQPTGTLTLSKSPEPIKFFAIGGQELWIDDVCPSP